MKKVLFSLFAVVLLAATMVSCGTDPLQQEVDEFKKQLPMDMGMGMLCTDVAIVGDYLTYSATIDEEYYGENIIDLFTENVDELKAAMLEDDDDPEVETVLGTLDVPPQSFPASRSPWRGPPRFHSRASILLVVAEVI